MKVSIRAEYPLLGGRNWYDQLKPIKTIGSIELAFHSPEHFAMFMKTSTDRESVLFPIRELGIEVPTIHMAHVNLTNLKLFMPVFVGTMKIARELNCHDIIIHPGNGILDDFRVVLQYAIFPLLEEYGCNFLWETFPGKRRILTAWEDLANFCREYDRNYICYDICHMQRNNSNEVIDDVETYFDLIRSFHISNWNPRPKFAQHLPIDIGVYDINKIVDTLVKLDFQGNLTMEYLPEYHDKLTKDAQYLLERIHR